MEEHGLQAISIGFLIEVDTPMVWRGPMVTQALEKLLRTPLARARLPGSRLRRALATSQLTCAEGAGHRRGDRDHSAGHRLHRRRKGLKMLRRSHPDPRVVENMSIHVCPNAAMKAIIFGSGGAARMCKDYGSELLGQLPLERIDPAARGFGKPTVVSDRTARLRRSRRIAAAARSRSPDRSAT